ncbi:MAG TPA: T9SS type A sorting domain-containing protein [Niastella sp.]
MAIHRHIIFLLLLLSSFVAGKAQQSGIYVPKAGKVYFSGDTATIFSSVVNQGKLGVDKKAVLNFKGKKWTNDAGSLITDEGNKGEDASGKGGVIRFNGDSGRQQIDGGYNAVTRTGAAFANIEINNAAGVEIDGSSTKIRNNLHFANGLVYLLNNTLVIGDGSPGTITGYDSVRYIVTGSAGTGLLVRENVRNSDSWVIFPIGSDVNAYTPVSMRSHASQGDDLHARVFDGVRKDLFTGDDLRNNGVNKTWEIGKRNRPNVDDVEVSIQHLTADEGHEFAANRRYSYISQYTVAGWDTSYPQIAPANGYLTSGAPYANSAVNTRSLKNKLGTTSYFTKFTGKGDTSLQVTKVWLSAYRKDANTVNVYWTTNPEVNIRYFVVERRLSNETNFIGRDSMGSRAFNGYSNTFIKYINDDANNYTGIGYYRLKLVDYSGGISYTKVVPVGGKPGGYQLLVWPNPTARDFYVGINGVVDVKYVVIWNVLGQMVHRELVNERGVIPMHINLPGTYFVGFISEGGQLLQTKKLLVTGD